MNSREQIITTNNGISILAPAKINLTLLIAGKRPDGFHEIETIMSKIDFFDELVIRPGIKAGIELQCNGPEWAPEGKDNLVYRAAELFFATCGRKTDINVTLTKNIPAGSGLGSASSDAAATLIGLNRYLQTDMDQKALIKMAAKLGSDVAFFLNGPLALCTGRGEKIEKIDENFAFKALLILPNISVSTKRVYANYTHNQALYEQLSARITGHIRKKRIDLTPKICTNMLEESCFGLDKNLAELKKRIESLNIKPCCLSGSGSAMFYVIDNADNEKAGYYKRKLEEQINCKSIIVRNNRW